MVTPVIVSPGNSKVIPLIPEFVVPQDGYQKQDCENAAAKRWIEKYGLQYASLGITILGDDLYCHQPLCEKIIMAFLFHTLLDLTSEKYQFIRQHLPTCKTFFDDLRALTRYLYFGSWENLLDFMIHGLELEFHPNTS